MDEFRGALPRRKAMVVHQQFYEIMIKVRRPRGLPPRAAQSRARGGRTVGAEVEGIPGRLPGGKRWSGAAR